MVNNSSNLTLMYPKELIQKIHHTLPEELLEALASDATFASIEKVATAHDFSVEQMHRLTSLISYRIMGVVSNTELKGKIQTELEVDINLANIVATELRDEILNKLPKELLSSQETVTKKIIEETSPGNHSSTIPEIAPQNLPMIEEGEMAHEVPHIEAPTPVAAQAPTTPAPAVPTPVAKPETPTKVQVATPDFRYPTGKDPYREPLA